MADYGMLIMWKLLRKGVFCWSSDCG